MANCNQASPATDQCGWIIRSPETLPAGCRIRSTSFVAGVRGGWTRPLEQGVMDMPPLRYSVDLTLDGCCDHRAITVVQSSRTGDS